MLGWFELQEGVSSKVRMGEEGKRGAEGTRTGTRQGDERTKRAPYNTRPHPGSDSSTYLFCRMWKCGRTPPNPVLVFGLYLCPFSKRLRRVRGPVLRLGASHWL